MTTEAKLNSVSNAILATMRSAKSEVERLDREIDEYKAKAKAANADLETMRMLVDLAERREVERREQAAVYVAMKNLLTIVES